MAFVVVVGARTGPRILSTKNHGLYDTLRRWLPAALVINSEADGPRSQFTMCVQAVSPPHHVKEPSYPNPFIEDLMDDLSFGQAIR